MHEIRLAHQSELNLIQNFIRDHWQKDHIFVKSHKLLDWQHLNKQEKCYNFVVAYNKESGEYDAILGFIPISQFDNTIAEKDIWLAIWKVKDEMNKSGLGLRLYFSLLGIVKPRSVGVLGISELALKIYSKLRYKTGRLDHFYIKSPSIAKFLISSINSKSAASKKESGARITDWDGKFFPILSEDIAPKKTARYVVNRYSNHPIYKYNIYCVESTSGDWKGAIIVTRKINVESSCCIRIVDWIGGFIQNLQSEFVKLIEKEGAEYIDFLCHIPDKNDEIENMGFVKKGLSDIVPNYFEPFLKQNINIDYAFKSKSPYVIFKGDSDQDRPNLIKNIE